MDIKSNKKKILVTGTCGNLGSSIMNMYQLYNYDFLFTSNNTVQKNTIKLDISSIKNVDAVVSHYNPDIIINCAAFTDVDLSYKHKKTCHDINVVGVENLIKGAEEAKSVKPN